jgi:SAM-dependent methyltransferase
MPRNSPRKPNSQPHLDYLGVDQFLQTVIDARALKTAFELRLIDRLLERQPQTLDGLVAGTGADPRGFRFLVGLLTSNRVIVERNGEIALSERFMGLLRFRDLLETKLDFAGYLSGDFIELFTVLITNPAAFMERSRLFGLFDYRRAQEHSAENYERTKVWMRLTTTLTRYEAQACLQHHDFAPYRRMLDVGGNSGEFALQLCRANPALTATVFDLPLVCDIGQERLLAEPECGRIGFFKGDARADALPGGYDLVTFKSMLHDWPEADADAFLAKAAHALDPGGTVLIFERAPIQPDKVTLSFAMLPTLLFFRSYRDPGFYESRLRALGFSAITVSRFDLETPFFLVSARKTPA